MLRIRTPVSPALLWWREWRCSARASEILHLTIYMQRSNQSSFLFFFLSHTIIHRKMHMKIVLIRSSHCAAPGEQLWVQGLAQRQRRQGSVLDSNQRAKCPRTELMLPQISSLSFMSWGGEKRYGGQVVAGCSSRRPDVASSYNEFTCNPNLSLTKCCLTPTKP